MKLQTLTANLVGGPKPRVLHGRNFLVFRTVPLVEGVHSGSNGPVFYPYEQIEKWTKAWNHKPVVVNHPKNESGEFISANEDPETLEAYGVGFMLRNIANDERRLQESETWLDVDRLDKVYDGLSKMVRDGLIMEVSTGLFSDNEQKEGEHNGTKYKMIATNFRPDHLALLPDLVGACSVKDGCGMFTAAQAAPAEKMEQFQDEMNRAWTRVFEVTTNCKCGGTCHKCKGESDMKLSEKKRTKMIDSLVASELWDEDDREHLEGLEDAKLLKKFEMLEDNEEDDDPPKGKKTANTGRKKAADDKASGDEPQTPEDEGQTPAGQPSDPSKQVERREKQSGGTEVPGSAKDSGTQNAFQAWLQTAPPGWADFVTEGVQANLANRDRYIETIMENEENEFEEEELKKMSNAQLKKLSRLAVGSNPVANSQASVALQDFTANAGGVRSNAKKSNKVLGLPTTLQRKEEKSKK